jgi:hypothetical protein
LIPGVRGVQGVRICGCECVCIYEYMSI